MLLALGLIFWGRSRRQELQFYLYAAAAWAWWCLLALLIHFDTGLVTLPIRRAFGDSVGVPVGLAGLALGWYGAIRLVKMGYRRVVWQPYVNMILADWHMEPADPEAELLRSA